MIFDFLLFPLFIFLMLTFGASLNYTITRLIRCDNGALGNLSIQGLFGVFFLGMLGVIANFFIPLSSALFLTILIAVMIFGLWALSHQRSLITRSELVYLTITTILLVPLVNNMEAGYDGGLYHIPHQLWIREERIIGLANFHGRFGFSSILEYVNAPLWVNNDLKLLSYSLTSVLVFFISFLASKASSTSGPTLALILGISINIALFNDYFQLTYTYTDTPAGLLFATAFIYGFWMVHTNNMISRSEWATFSLLVLFALLMKVSSATLFLWVIFVIIYLSFSKRTSAHEFFIGISIPTVLFTIWIIHNIMITGCILFPEKLSCINVLWAAESQAEWNSKWVTAWARHPSSGLYSLDDNSWLSEWWYPKYSDFLTDFIKTGALVLLLYILSSATTRFETFKGLDLRNLASALFVIIAISFWFWKAPTPRFGIGVFIIFTPVIFIFVLGRPYNHAHTIYQTRLILLLLVISILNISPWKNITIEELTTFNKLPIPASDVKNDNVFGVRPTQGNQCWSAPECSPYDRPNIQTLHGFKAFIPNR